MFFRTNQTTCQEWVNRMASAALTASVRVGRHASAARFGLNLLTHWTLTRRAVGTCANVVRINKCDVFFLNLEQIRPNWKTWSNKLSKVS